eukprot:6359733-Pyramimonas_sp.AAC.1
MDDVMRGLYEDASCQLKAREDSRSRISWTRASRKGARRRQLRSISFTPRPRVTLRARLRTRRAEFDVGARARRPGVVRGRVLEEKPLIKLCEIMCADDAYLSSQISAGGD